jgi:hypothetical protein
VWASLIFEDLEVQEDTAAVQQVLKQCLRRLQSLYADSLKRICKAHSNLVDLARFALGWLTYGFRALTVSGLITARQIEIGRPTLNSDLQPSDSRAP